MTYLQKEIEFTILEAKRMVENEGLKASYFEVEVLNLKNESETFDTCDLEQKSLEKTFYAAACEETHPEWSVFNFQNKELMLKVFFEDGTGLTVDTLACHFVRNAYDLEWVEGKKFEQAIAEKWLKEANQQLASDWLPSRDEKVGKFYLGFVNHDPICEWDQLPSVEDLAKVIYDNLDYHLDDGYCLDFYAEILDREGEYSDTMFFGTYR